MRVALAEVSKAIRRRQDQNAVYYYNRSIYYVDLEDHEKAIAHYSEAIRLGSDKLKKRQDLFTKRGNMYMQSQDYGKALAGFSEVTIQSRTPDS